MVDEQEKRTAGRPSSLREARLVRAFVVLGLGPSHSIEGSSYAPPNGEPSALDAVSDEVSGRRFFAWPTTQPSIRPCRGLLGLRRGTPAHLAHASCHPGLGAEEAVEQGRQVEVGVDRREMKSLTGGRDLDLVQVCRGGRLQPLGLLWLERDFEAAVELDHHPSRLLVVACEFLEVIKTGGKAAQLEALENPEAYDDETEELLSWFDAETKRRGLKVA